MAAQLPQLFGSLMTPDQAADARALQFSQMSPQQQMQYNIYRNVNRLGRGVAGLLGAEVEDPTMKKASQLRQLASQFDTETADGMLKYAKAIKDIDPNLSLQAVQQAQDMREKEASIAQKTAAANRERQQSIPTDIVKSQTIAAIKQAVRSLESREQTPDVVAALQIYKDQLASLEPKEKPPTINYGAEADRAAKARFGKNFSELTQAEARIIDDLLEARGIKKAKEGRTTVDLSGLKDAGDITAFRKDVQAITKPYQDQIDAADDAISLATMAINNQNFAAVASLSRSLAKAAGETQLSGKDVEAFGIDPSLVGRVADTTSRLVKSRPTVDTLNKLRQLAEAIKKKAEGRLTVEEEQLQATARASKRFTDEQINTVFRRRPAQTPKQNTRTTRSGVTYTVEND